MGRIAGESMAAGVALLFGRRTYQDFYSVWPNRPKPNPFTDVLNNTLKYVASRTLKEALPWMNSTLLAGEAAQAVAKLKAERDTDVVILGSGELAQSLMRHNLIDRYVLLIHPLVLGTGQKLFRDQAPRLPLRMVESKTTPTGVALATYVPADRSGAG
jgi:dihydrofolate reductase